MPEPLLSTTTFSIDGYRIVEYKGLVRGIIVRSPTLGQGFLGGLRQIIGGQIAAYAEMCEQARAEAYDLLMEHARALRANAVIWASGTKARKSGARDLRRKSCATGRRW